MLVIFFTYSPQLWTVNPFPPTHFEFSANYPIFASGWNNWRERIRSLLYFSDMATKDKTEQIRELVESLLSVDNQYFIVKISIRPINNITVFIDGDAGVTIEKCVKLNRALYKQIVETGVCNDGEFSL